MVLRRSLWLLFVLAVVSAALAARAYRPLASSFSRQHASGLKAVTLPLMFEPGPEEQSFVARSRGYAVTVTSDGAMLRSRSAAVRLRFVGGKGTIAAEKPLTTRINHLQG